MRQKPRYPRACSYYIPVSEDNYEWVLCWNEGLSEPIWSPRRQVPVGGIKIGKPGMDYPNPVDYQQVEAMLTHFNRSHWLPICLDHEGYLLDGQHRLQVCRRKGLLLVDAIVQCADHERIRHEARERRAEEEKQRKHKRRDIFGNWLTKAEWKEQYGTARGLDYNQ